jgi:hypothetical protein
VFANGISSSMGHNAYFTRLGPHRKHRIQQFLYLFNVTSVNTTNKTGISSMKTTNVGVILFNVSVDSATCFDPQFRSSSGNLLWSTTQTIKVNNHDMDPYATDVYSLSACCIHWGHCCVGGYYIHNRMQSIKGSFIVVRRRGNVFTKPLPSNGRLFYLNYSDFKASHHICIQKLLGGGHTAWWSFMVTLSL